MTATGEQAAGRECPNCGLPYYDDDPGEYECVRCGTVGYDCCIPGNHAICSNCEDEDAVAHPGESAKEGQP